MDNIDDQRVPRLVKSQKKGQKANRKKNKNDSLKVVYISSPMKVKTSASRFRSLVQQLTGKNSDISEYMEGGHFDRDRDFYDVDYDESGELDRGHDQTMSSSVPYMDMCRVSPTSSDSLGAMDSVFGSQVEEPFAGIFKSSYFSFNRPQMDVLGTYDELL